MDQLYKKYFESVPCFLTVQDRDFRIIDANDRFTKSFGNYDGRYCYQVYKNRPNKCENCPVDRTFRDGQRHYSEEILRTLDGREVAVVVYTTPIHNDNGDIISVMEMSTDVTEIKLLQKQLHESQERYRLLFEEVPCYISIQDKNLRIVDANRMHREKFGTAYGNKCYEVYKHRDKACMPCIVLQTFQDGQIRTHEEVVSGRDDKPLHVLVTTAPIRDGNGDIEHVVEMSADITTIRELQDKLSSVGLLIGSISHGIKGLLNGLDGGIYLVNSGLQKNNTERLNKGWDIALRNVRRIRSMVMDILYYAKDREPIYEEIKAVEYSHEICRIMEDRAKKLDIEYSCDIDESTGVFEADPHAVRSMLLNLIENSLDACRIDSKKDKHQIMVGVKGSDDTIVFEISDNGIGMDRETCDKAFSLFFSSKGAGGTGLGLFISNKIARAHGGHISIESAENIGSKFIVELPRKRPNLTSDNE